MPSSGSRFQLIVFDLDGTLIDSRRDIAASANALLVQCGAEALPDEEVGRMVGEGAAVLVERAFKARRIAPPDDALPRFLEIYAAHLTDETRPYPGIPAALDALRSRATLALLTNKPLAATRTILDRLGLQAFFPTSLVFGGDGPFPRKPDPSGLRELMRKTDSEPLSTVLVGDSLIDWRTARAAACTICLAAYGFGFIGFPIETIGSDDLQVTSPADLSTL
ncbi:MAG TPA: HAD hydrolase-like protein [Vicinamibacterales bacterium]